MLWSSYDSCLLCLAFLIGCCMHFIPVSSMMGEAKMPQKVAVIGATGRLGRIAVQQLVDQGIGCNLLIRNIPSNNLGGTAPATLTTTSTKEEVVAYLASLNDVTVVEGDVGNISALKNLLQDCTACLALYGASRRSLISDLWNGDVENDPSHAKQVNYQGVANILLAAKESCSCRRIVRITGKGEDPTSFFSILINLLGSMAKAWNYEGERLLRLQNDIEYTIIRPGIMSNDGPTGNVLALVDNGGDLKVSKIRYADIAALCIESLKYEKGVQRSTLTAMTVPEGEGSSSWNSLLEKVQPDRREFPSDMLEKHKSAVRNALVVFMTVSTLVIGFFLQYFASLLK